MERITSKDNLSIKHAAKLISSRKERDGTGLFVCEGARLCFDGVKSGHVPEEFYVTETALKKYPELSDIARLCPKTARITDSIAAKISDTESPQGVFAVFKRLDNGKSAVTIKGGGKYILLASLQDPGNVGTVMRTCEAFGIDGLILSADCPDIYGPKVLRASMGAVFRLSIQVCDDTQSEIRALQSAGVKVFAACAGGCDINNMKFTAASAVVIGNEGGGISREMAGICDGSAAIPMRGRAESLNAATAAGILIWEMTKRQV